MRLDGSGMYVILLDPARRGVRARVEIGDDMREPITDVGGYSQLMSAKRERSRAFEQRRLLRTRRTGRRRTAREVLTDAGEVPWDVKVRDGVAYRTSYQGEHYGAGVPVTVAGAVARTHALASTALNGFTLTEPLEDVVQQVIRGIMPAFYYALDADTFAIATDPTARFFRLRYVSTTPLTVGARRSRPIPWTSRSSFRPGRDGERSRSARRDGVVGYARRLRGR